MKKLYDRNPLGFALAWVGVYVLVLGTLRANYGETSAVHLAALCVLSALSLAFVGANRLWGTFGLNRWPDNRRFLYFIPFVLLVSVNLWAGISAHDTGAAQVRAVLSMALIGYLEEIIFRGFLFRAMERDGVKWAIVISAVTFGAGHIVNLLTGQGSLETVLQMVYAIAVGFAFVMVFYKGESLLPCILTHSLVNITSCFSNTNLTAGMQALMTYGSAAFILVVAGGYAWYLFKKA